MKALDAETACLATAMQGIGGIHRVNQRSQKGKKKKNAAGEGESSKTDMSVEQDSESGANTKGKSVPPEVEEEPLCGLERKPKRARGGDVGNIVVNPTGEKPSGTSAPSSTPFVPEVAKTFGTVSGPSQRSRPEKEPLIEAEKCSQFIADLPDKEEWSRYQALGFNPLFKEMMSTWLKVDFLVLLDFVVT